MSIEKRVSLLEEKVSKLIKLNSKLQRHIEVKLLASNDHTELELKISTWLRKAQPEIVATKFVADGAEYTYCVMFLFKPSKKPLPDRR